MLTSFIKIAWRNITRHKVFSILNVLGLALGICGCIVLYLIVHYDFSFDKFHPGGDRIYRIVGERANSQGEKEFVNSPFDDVAAFETQIPGYTSKMAFFHFGEDIRVPDGDKPARQFENHIPGSYSATAILTRGSYFDVLPHDWLEGEASVLNQPFRVVLTEERARLYFGNIPLKDMIGRQVDYGDSIRATVGGIVRGWTQHSDFAFTDYVSLGSATHSFMRKRIPTEGWSSLQPHQSNAFVKLDPGVTPEQVNARFAAYIKDHIHWSHSKLTMYLQPMNGVHFTPEFHRGDDGDDFPKAYMPTLYALIGVAIFILLLATVNFVNLSTAQSMHRAREIGVRKVMGGGKGSIMVQFLIETTVLTLFAALLAVFLVRPVLQLFSDYVPDVVAFHPLDPGTLAFLVSVVVGTTLLAGYYPARVLASYLPVRTLKGTVGGRGATLRRALIVFQFVISLVFIIGALVIQKQIQFMRSVDKGFNYDAIMTVNRWARGEKFSKVQALGNALATIPGATKVQLDGHDPMGYAQSAQSFRYYGGKDTVQVEAMTEWGDDGFIPFYQMKLVAGRNMVHSDSLNELVINETMARKLGFQRPSDAVGHFLVTFSKPHPIVGVVADFHMESFHDAIKPTVILFLPDQISQIAVKLSPAVFGKAGMKTLLARMEAESKKVFPGRPFEYKFMSDAIAELYSQEENTAWLATASMLVTIFISCMGLFGLAMFSARRRVKEIGIRKVLGAGVGQILVLLNRDFVVLVALSLVIATPIAYYLSNLWLEDFVERTGLSWWIFALAGLGAVVIALLTVSYQAYRAARANPVDSLRTE